MDLNPTRGHEQSGRRPCLVLSVDKFNHGPADLVVVVPITTRDKRIVSHVRIEPPAGGLKETSYIKCEEVRCVAKQRFHKLAGTIDSKAMSEVEYRVAAILGLVVP